AKAITPSLLLYLREFIPATFPIPAATPSRPQGFPFRSIERERQCHRYRSLEEIDWKSGYLERQGENRMRLTFSLVCLSVSLSWAATNPVAERTLVDLPVSFEPNRGQWPRDVEFGAHIRGHLYAITRREIVIDGAVHLEIAPSLRGKLEPLDPTETRTNYLY